MSGVLSFFNRIFSGAAAKGSNRITAGELKALMSKGGELTIIDVRTPLEFRKGRIPGSVSIPLDSLAGLKGVPYRGKVVVYCASGVRSRKAQKLLRERGAADVVDLQGGIGAWTSSGGESIGAKG